MGRVADWGRLLHSSVLNSPGRLMESLAIAIANERCLHFEYSVASGGLPPRLIGVCRLGAHIRRLLTPQPGRGERQGRKRRTEEDFLLGARVASSSLGLLDSCKVQALHSRARESPQRLPLFAVTIPPLRTIDVWK